MPGPGRGAGRFREPRHVQFAGRLRGQGHRMTGPRRMIIEVLGRATEYLSADEIYMDVYALHPGVGIATVYRTLQMLSELGITERLDTGDGKARYRLSHAEEQPRRIALVCTRCRRTISVNADAAGDAARSIERTAAHEYGFHTNRTVIQLYGLCEACSQSRP